MDCNLDEDGYLNEEETSRLSKDERVKNFIVWSK
jgi:hypothetical protein